MEADPGLIDISVSIRAGMAVWPGDPPVETERLQDIEKGDEATVSRIIMGAHSGTHVDAPLHYMAAGAGIDDMPPDALVGPARVIDVRGGASGGSGKKIGKAELERHNISQGERILLKTTNSGLWRTRSSKESNDHFHKEFIHLGADAALFLATKKIRAIGIDYLSIGGYMEDGAPVHKMLLGAGIWIIEGLDLSPAAPGSYELICLPLKMKGLEAAPARAYLRKTS